MEAIKQLSRVELESGLEEIYRAPGDNGVLEMIVSRPHTGERQQLSEGWLDVHEGLVGDNWQTRGSSSTRDGSANLDAQLTIMNARAAALVAQDRARWQLAGDQLFVDMDISVENLPAGARLGIGSAVVEVTALPHAGCIKFRDRFGLEALKFVNSPEGKRLRLRGLNARVVQAGVIRTGDVVRKL